MFHQRNSLFHCTLCKAPYKTKFWLQKHIAKNHPPQFTPLCKPLHPSPDEVISNIDVEPIKTIKVPNAKKKAYIKQKINPIIRFNVWKTYIGRELEAKCFCCCKNKITPFTGHHTFQAGHIIAERMGGKCEIDNLLPICRDCNKNMGIQHWDNYIKYNRLPARIFGAEIPSETHNCAFKIQKCWHKWKNKKKKGKKRRRKKRKKVPNYMKLTKSFRCYLKEGRRKSPTKI